MELRKFRAAERLLETCIDAAEAAGDPLRPQLATYLGNLAEVYV